VAWRKLACNHDDEEWHWTTASLTLISSSMWTRQSPQLRRCCYRPLMQNRSFSSSVKVTKTRASHPSALTQHDDSATALVDDLIQYTRQLMTESNSNHHVVAYSGGVDSSLVTALLQQASDHTHSVQAVLGISPAVSQEQTAQARDVASYLNVSFNEVRTTEGSDEMYIENNGQACFACKTHLYSSLQAVQNVALTHDSHRSAQLYNGTNGDDLQDATRVGLIAAANFHVLSPLQHTPKQDVRRAALHLGLPNWNAAAAPCLRSRLALGIEATRNHLHMIEQAERFVKSTLLKHKLHNASNVRVRMLTNQRAMIEVDAGLLEELRLGEVEQTYFQSLGFSSVSARQFHTGSVARRVKEVERQKEHVDVDETSRQVVLAVG